MAKGNEQPTAVGLRIDPDKAAAELCRRSLAFFVKEFWNIIIAEELVWAPHMQVLCDEVEALFRRVFMRYDAEGKKLGRLPKEHDMIINVPPGTSKSTIISVMAPAWAWANDPTLRIIGASYAGDLAVSLAIKSRDIIRSAKYRRYFPNIETKSDEDNKTNYKNTAGGQRLSTSTGGASTGEHAHIILVDDPLNPKQAASAVELEGANEWVDITLSTRKVDKAVTPMLFVMQRLAVEDVSGHLLKKRPKTIRHICLPAELSKDVAPAAYRDIYVDGLLDPVRMPKAVLQEQHTTLGSAGYAGQIQQNPIPPGGLIWKKEWFILVDDEVFPSRELMTQFGTDWDLAYTKDETNAATAYISAGKLGANIWIDDLNWRWLEFPEMVNWMQTIKGPHYIEAKASGKSAKQTLQQRSIIAIEVNVKGGADKVARANMATPTAEAGMVYLRRSLADRLFNDTKQGILQFPRGPYKDLADTLAQCIQRLNKKSEFSTSSANESDYEEDEDWAEVD